MKYRFSAIWSDKLGAAIEAQCPKEGYQMELKAIDAETVVKIVNLRPIDEYLEACYVPERGDDYVQSHLALKCKVSPKSLRCLVRRMMQLEPDMEETGFDEDDVDWAHNLASSICEALEIELI